MITKFYGLNIAVKDLPEATERYRKLLGLEPKHMPESGFAFPGLEGTQFDLGGVKIHLITSKQPNTSIAKFLEAKGEGLFLISLASDDIENDVPKAEAAGAKFISPTIFSGNFGKVNFIHPKSTNGVQIEIYQPAE